MSDVTCDHDRCPTKFCPNCGQQTAGLPIYGLRSHIAKFILIAKAEVQRMKALKDQSVGSQDIDVNHRRADRIAHQILQREAVVVKWKSWLDALDELLPKQPHEETPT